MSNGLSSHCSVKRFGETSYCSATRAKNEMTHEERFRIVPYAISWKLVDVLVLWRWSPTGKFDVLLVVSWALFVERSPWAGHPT